MTKGRKRGRKPKPLDITWEHRPSPDGELMVQRAFRMLLGDVTESDLEAAKKKLQEKERKDQEA